MELHKVLHMVGGEGESSYAKNSSHQRGALEKIKPIVEEAIVDVYCSNSFPERLCIADLGCSSGPNTLFVVSEIMEVINAKCKQLSRFPPEFLFFLNDLPGNDFNTIFKSLPAFYEKFKKEKLGPYFIVGVPGSFYQRILPTKSLHFVHSSASVHWLSQVPQGLECNKGNVYISETSSSSVSKAYLDQFKRDFSTFLSLRSEEILPGGRMFIIVLGSRSEDPSSGKLWELFSKSLNDMVSLGLIEEAKVDSFNFPFYFPSPEQVRGIVDNEGSFYFNRLETFDTNWVPDDDDTKDFVYDKFTSGKNISNNIRAGSEPLLATHFGEAIMDDLFHRFAERIAEHLNKEKTKHVTLVMSMTKK